MNIPNNIFDLILTHPKFNSFYYVVVNLFFKDLYTPEHTSSKSQIKKIKKRNYLFPM